MSSSRRRFLGRLAAMRRSRLALLLALVVAVPLAVAGFFVSALGGAAEKGDAIPAMVVNEDAMIPADTADGTPVFAGRQLVTELTSGESPGFRWTVSNAADARRALERGDAYAVLTIPSDFSRTIVSLSGGEPARATVQLRTDDAHGYLAGSAAQSIGDAMARSFGTEITSRYLASFYEGLSGMGGSLADAADGAGRIADGASGLSTGLDALARGAADSTSGAKDLAAGVRDYTTGVDGVADGLAALDEQTAGLGRLGQGLSSYLGGTQQLAAALAQANAELQAADPLDPVALGTARAKVDALTRQLSAATAQAGSLQAGAASLGGVHDGIARLDTGAARLSAGSEGLRGGADALAGGLGGLASGAQQSASGARQLTSGASELAEGLRQGAQQTEALGAGDAAERAGVVADPVGVEVQRDNPVASVAQAVGVVALPVALWLGAIAVFLLLRPVTRHALASTASSGRLVLRSLARAGMLSLAQAAPLVLLLHLALQVPWTMLPATLAFSALLALAFTAVHHALTALLGRAGIVVSLILLALQLAVMPGLLPGPAVSAPFQAVSSLLPLGHAVAGMQAVVAGNGAAAGAAAAVLLAWAAAAVLVGYWRVARSRSARGLRMLSPA